jgi:hypothetical protein
MTLACIKGRWRATSDPGPAYCRLWGCTLFGQGENALAPDMGNMAIEMLKFSASRQLEANQDG